MESTSEELPTHEDTLSYARSDLQNLVEGMKIATIFLDANGKIRSFSDSAARIYDLKATDIGRSLREIKAKAQQMPPLPSFASLATSEPSDEELQTEDGAWFLQRVLPYLHDGRPAGMILTFVDVSATKQAERRLTTAHNVTQLLAAADSFEEVIPEILEAVRSRLDVDFCALWLIDARTGTLYCAEKSVREDTPRLDALVEHKRNLRFKKGQGLPGSVWETGEPQWNANVVSNPHLLGKALTEASGIVSGVALPIMSGRRCYGVVELFADHELENDQSLLEMLAEVGREVGQFVRRTRLDEKYRDEESRKTAILESALDCIVTMDLEGSIVDFNAAAEETFGVSRTTAVGKPLAETIIPPELRVAHRKGLERFLETGESKILGKRIELEAQRASGERFPVELAINVSHNRDGTPFFTAYLRDITSRKRAEAKSVADELRLKENQTKLIELFKQSVAANAKLQVLFDQSHYYAGILDIDGTLTDVNHTALEQCGYSREEVIDRPFWSTAWWEKSPAVQETVREAIERAAEGGSFRQELPYWLSDGTERISDFALIPARNEHGEVIFLIATGSDITERKQTELSLIASEGKSHQLAAVVERSNDFISIATPQGQVVYLNESGRRMVGLDTDFDVTQTHITDYLIEEDRDFMIKEAIPEFKREGRWLGEIHYRHWQTGESIPSLWNTVAIKDPGGPMPESWVTISPDLADYKQLQTALSETEQRLTMALKAAGMTAWEWTPEELIWTETMNELIGLPEGTPGSTDLFFQQVHEEDLPGLLEIWKEVTAGNKPYYHEFRVKLPNGGVRWIAGIGEFKRDPLGKVECIFGMNWDVTEERAAVEVLQEKEQLAHQANVAKSQFLANMSHEIRTPMTAVLGYADMLAAQEDDPKKSEYLQTIKRNGKYLLELINDILDLSKIEAGKLEVVREPFAVQRIVNDVRSTMDVRAREKQLDFVIEYDGKIPATIVNDSKRLRQILVNLIGNAIKFTESGSVRLVVRYLAGSSEPCIQFDVIDTGVGITQEQLKRLFQSFSQADASVTRKFGGTGLGLAISQRLANMLGGEIKVSSTPGEGSVFTCTIAVGDLNDADLIHPSFGEKEYLPTPQRDGAQLSCRVLVVDDRRDVRFLTQRILTDAGAEVSSATDGFDALQTVEEAFSLEKGFDLILLDMQMPRLDGYQTAARLREMKFSKPIIALTADAMHGDMDLCLRSGCNAYLSKPIDAQELIDVVIKHTT